MATFVVQCLQHCSQFDSIGVIDVKKMIPTINANNSSRPRLSSLLALIDLTLFADITSLLALVVLDLPLFDFDGSVGALDGDGRKMLVLGCV